MKLTLLIIFLCSLIPVASADSSQPLVIDEDFVTRNLAHDLYYFEDIHNAYNFNTAVNQIYKRYHGSQLNLGFTQSGYWFRLNIINQGDEQHLVIENRNATVDELDFYILRSDGAVDKILSGDQRSYHNRTYKFPFVNYSFRVFENEKITLYIRAKSENSLSLPLILSKHKTFVNNLVVWLLLSGFFYGIAIGLLIYNIFLYVYLKESAYYFYCLNIFFTIAFFTVFDGYGSSIWPESFSLQRYASCIFSTLAIIFALLFTRHYLQIKPHSKELTIIQYNLFANGLILVSIAFIDSQTQAILTTLASTAAAISLVAVSILRLKYGYRPALHSIIAWGSLVTAILFSSLGLFGVDLPFISSLVFLKIGFVAQLLILSVGLAYRINLMREEKVISDQRIYETKLAGEQKVAFLARMNHEIRTPMNGIVGIVELLRESKEGEKQDEYLDSLKSSTDSLVEIINDILDYSKIQAGSLTLEIIPFDLVKLINESIAIFSVTLTEKQVRLTTNNSTNLPAVVCGDPTRLKQILFNLLSNAVKFTDRGQIVVSVETEAPGYQYGDASVKLRFTVEDSGTGINKERLDSIFDAFSQSNSAVKKEFGGTGLGLAICKDLTEVMGGNIGVTSEEGVGSRFWFTVNLGVVNELQPAGSNDHFKAQKMSDFHGTHCLVVDDNQVNKMVLVRILTSLGAICTSSSDGEEAVDAFIDQRESIDIVFMDCEMPGLDGYAASETIRELEKNYLSTQPVPIIAITAYTEDEYKQKCFAAGMNDHLPKPISKEQIVKTLHKWLDNKTSEKDKAHSS